MDVTLTGRCPSCGQPRLEAPRCECGHMVWSHRIDRHCTRRGCYITTPTGACTCIRYRRCEDPDCSARGHLVHAAVPTEGAQP